MVAEPQEVVQTYSSIVSALTDFLTYSYRKAQSPMFAPVQLVWGEAILAGMYYAMTYPKSARKILEKLKGAPAVMNGQFGAEYVDELASCLSQFVLDVNRGEDAMMDKWRGLQERFREEAGR